MSENDNNFEALRQLLALKKHEMPPPGYFEDFSARVGRRIRTLDEYDSRSTNEQFQETSPWLYRFLELVQARPALVGMGTVGAFVLLAAGIVLVNRPEAAAPQLATSLAPMDSSSSLDMPQTIASADFAAGVSNVDEASLTTGTNVSLQPVASMFGSGNSLLQPASFNGN